MVRLPSGSLESAAGRWEAGIQAADPSRAFGDSDGHIIVDLLIGRGLKRDLHQGCGYWFTACVAPLPA